MCKKIIKTKLCNVLLVVMFFCLLLGGCKTKSSETILTEENITEEIVEENTEKNNDVLTTENVKDNTSTESVTETEENEVIEEKEVLDKTLEKNSESSSSNNSNKDSQSKTNSSNIENSTNTISEQTTSSYCDLFYENDLNIYNYCPSVLVEGNNINVFYCSNVSSGVVLDHICYRTCTLADNGYIYSDKIDILQPTSGSWDSIHVCAPSVVSGNFIYDGVSYRYLMTYLGCNTTDNQNNKIGLAVSNSLNSGWTKVDAVNPFIDFVYDNAHSDTFQWGVGQPSIINLDGNGKILVCYTKGTYDLTSEIAELWDLSNLNNPVKLGETTINNPNSDFISNADFALSGNTLYMICDTHPFDSGILSNVAHCSTVYRTEINISDIIGSLSGCSWTAEYEINQNISGHKRNHNAGLFRDSYGNLSSRSILYTVADEINDFSNSLFSYRLKRSDF